MPDKPNPFGEDVGPPERMNPFGEDDEGGELDPIRRVEHAASRIRRLGTQLGAEGLPPSAMRSLIEELSKALDATARALREARRPR
ncbi:MAG: hypothetical protein ACRELV_05750 [Longimicrobiales bacterium]